VKQRRRPGATKRRTSMRHDQRDASVHGYGYGYDYDYDAGIVSNAALPCGTTTV
jgi:hypothetical protein